MLFDFNGVLIDSIPLWEEAFKKTVENAGLPLYMYNHNFAKRGYTLADKWTYFLSSIDVVPQVAFNDLVRQTESTFINMAYEQNLDVLDGFYQFAAELKEKNYSLGLVSNSRKFVIDSILEKLKLRDHVFDVIVTSEEVKNPKPKRDIYIAACQRLNILPSKALVFEDSIPGATASTKAGCTTIIIWDGSYERADYPHSIVYFFVDFTPFAGNLDRGLMETVEEFKNLVMEQPPTPATSLDTVPPGN